MTCIVGLVEDGKVWLAGDRAAVGDGHYLTLSGHPKVFRNGPFIMGFTNSFRMGQLLQYRLAPPDLPSEVDFDEFMATTFVDAVRDCLKTGGYTKIECERERIGQFLVGVEGRLYTFDDDYNVRRCEHDYDAIGSGISVAHGSLYSTSVSKLKAKDRLTLALDAAAYHTTTVRKPFDVLCDD